MSAPDKSELKSPSATKRPRVGKSIINTLGREICTGVFGSEGTLPSEANLCTRYGVSRTVIREALNVVMSKGLISRRSRVGTRITSQDEWNILDAQVLEWLGPSSFKTNLYESVLEARQLIEVAAVELAAERATVSEIYELEAVWKLMAASSDSWEKFNEADVEFHKILLKASHNRIYQQLAHSFKPATRHLLQVSARSAVSLDEAVAIHGDLVEALRMRDKPSAKDAMLKMLELSARDLALASKIESTN